MLNKTSWQYLIPQTLLTKLAGKFASSKNLASQLVIRKFIQTYQVNMQEALLEAPEDYATFNDFFTRQLKPAARPLAANDLVCPVDGKISQLGQINHDQIIQAKGLNYSLAHLLADSDNQQYLNGSFATIYLSPRDYHRIHMPCAASLQKMTYVPGKLFSVNPPTVNNISNLFTRNERVICHFTSSVGNFAVILVGATIVGSIATSWHGVVNSPRPQQLTSWDYHQQNIHLAKGAELGKFLLGSTIILLFAKDMLNFVSNWHANKAVVMGEAMADINA